MTVERKCLCVDRICLYGRVTLCDMRQKYMSAYKGKFARGQNKYFAFEHFFIQGNFTKALGKLNTNLKIRKYKLCKKLYPS